jgi:UDP-perosamine 4-acetyltransferase
VSHGRRRAIVVGAGGHARVVVSILDHMEDVEGVGVADRTAATRGEAVGSTKVTATFEELPALRSSGVDWAVPALGDNRERADMFTQLVDLGFNILTLRHPTAIVENSARVGPGAVICAGAIICAEVVLGADVLINTGAIIDHECRIGAHAHVGPGCRIAGRVTIGDAAFIGAGTTVRDRITIGAGAVIGAGSVVVDEIPAGVAAYGVPARGQRHA